MKTCQQCGKLFDPVNERPSHPAKYCSRSCRDDSQRTKVLMTCRQCGKQFHRKAYMKDWSKDRGPFCGFGCYGQWQHENLQGAASPTYLAVKSRNGCDHRKARELAIARDRNRCVDCGKTGRLHVHHLGEPDNHDLDNLVTVCPRCHVHRHPDRRGPQRAPNGQFQKS